MKVQIVILFMAIASACCCETPCTKEMNPVCGTDGVNFEFFSNECMMTNQMCRDGKSWKRSDLRSCAAGLSENFSADKSDSSDDTKDTSSCLVPCPAVARPVCGYNGVEYKTFPNSCVMSNANCLLTKDAYVTAPPEKCGICNNLCPAVIIPVCGYNGKNYEVFQNDCLMDSTNCQYGDVYEKVSLEKCQPTLLARLSVACTSMLVCPAIYAPSCGYDGNEYRVFGSSCAMNSYNCLRSESWKTVSLDLCPTEDLYV